jgi:hypothetical protein
MMFVRVFFRDLSRYACCVSAFGLASAGPFISTASASTPRSQRDQLALELAVVAAHEGALDNPREAALIWQVVEARAETTQGRLMFLRAHSARALGRKTCSIGNCIWSRELLTDPEHAPASLSAAWWNAMRAPAWLALQRYAAELVYGIELWRPCPVAPYSWGYAGDLESAWRERRLVPIGCEGTMNDGFTVAPRELTAAIAKSGTLHVSRARPRGRAQRVLH